MGKVVVAGAGRNKGWRPFRAVATALSALCLLWAASPRQGHGQGYALEVSLRPPPGMESRSVGFVFEGRLLRGQRLTESAYVRHMPDCIRADRFYGTWGLNQLLLRAARRVAVRLPGARLSVGELSAKRGGTIPGHRSHQSGRDVDIGFYLVDAGGRPAYTEHFLDVRADGRVVDRSQGGLGELFGMRFDAARNWELIEKLVTDDVTRVQYIFVADTVAELLLSHARATGASPVIQERARAVMVQPDHGHPHRNHFHVRTYCAPSDRPRCRDQAPFWPWYPGPIPGGLFASLERARKVFE